MKSPIEQYSLIMPTKNRSSSESINNYRQLQLHQQYFLMSIQQYECVYVAIFINATLLKSPNTQTNTLRHLHFIHDEEQNSFIQVWLNESAVKSSWKHCIGNISKATNLRIDNMSQTIDFHGKIIKFVGFHSKKFILVLFWTSFQTWFSEHSVSTIIQMS